MDLGAGDPRDCHLIGEMAKHLFVHTDALVHQRKCLSLKVEHTVEAPTRYRLLWGVLKLLFVFDLSELGVHGCFGRAEQSSNCKRHGGHASADS